MFLGGFQTVEDVADLDLAFEAQGVGVRNLHLAFAVSRQLADLLFQCVGTGLQLGNAAEDLGEEVLDSLDRLGNGVLDGQPDFLQGFANAFHRNGGGSGLARLATEGFQGRGDAGGAQAQATGVALNRVLHEQSCLRIQTAVLHGRFHGDHDAFQAFGDVAQLLDVVGALLGFGEGFGGVGDFLFNGFVRADNQVGFVEGVIFHGDEQLTQRSRHAE
ncbi:hypothetical protein D3C72_624280 [compost metagenome]